MRRDCLYAAESGVERQRRHAAVKDDGISRRSFVTRELIQTACRATGTPRGSLCALILRSWKRLMPNEFPSVIFKDLGDSSNSFIESVRVFGKNSIS